MTKISVASAVWKAPSRATPSKSCGGFPPANPGASVPATHTNVFPRSPSWRRCSRVHPDVTAFIELKREALNSFGVEAVLTRAIRDLESVRTQCVLISFSLEALAPARAAGWRVGAVIEHWHERKQPALQRLAPEFLFCDVNGLPWWGKLRFPGAKVVIYEVDDAEVARKLTARGADFIETFAIGSCAPSSATKDLEQNKNQPQRTQRSQKKPGFVTSVLSVISANVFLFCVLVSAERALPVQYRPVSAISAEAGTTTRCGTTVCPCPSNPPVRTRV